MHGFAAQLAHVQHGEWGKKFHTDVNDGKANTIFYFDSEQQIILPRVRVKKEYSAWLDLIRCELKVQVVIPLRS